MTGNALTVSLAEYLETTYRPDVEYLDGHLKEKSVTGFQHGVIQGLLFHWFRSRRKEWEVLVSVETRTQVEPNRVRLPDVVVVRIGEQAQGSLTKAPLIAIEVLSPTDSYTDLKERAADLRAMGTENVWLLDPLRRTAEIWTGKHWQLFETNRLAAVNSPAYLDLDWLWAEMEDDLIVPAGKSGQPL